MNLKTNCQDNPLTLIALYKLVEEIAADKQVQLNGPLATVCKQAAVNRTQVYERKQQIEEALSKVSLPLPGAPLLPPEAEAHALAERNWRLREQVLRYRAEHPGAVVQNSLNGKASYSDQFVRFILDLNDQWDGSNEQFCQQAEIPSPTLVGWKKKPCGKTHHPSNPNRW